MQLDIEVWLRGQDHATNDLVEVDLPEPAGWTDPHVRTVLAELLRAIDRARDPDADRARLVAMRGFSWIVSPFENRGVTIAVEIQLGAAAAGPFAIDQAELEQMITRVMAAERAAATGAPRVH